MLVKTFEPLEALDNHSEVRLGGSTTPHRINMTVGEVERTDNRPMTPSLGNKQFSNVKLKNRKKCLVLQGKNITLTTNQKFYKKTAATQNIRNHKLTDFFPVRRSARKPKKTVLEEKQRDFEHKVRCGIEDGLEVQCFPQKGRGIVTTRDFVKGEFVVEYIGDLIDQNEARKREVKYAKDHNAGCYMYYFQHKNTQYCVDATAETSQLGRLVNHSRNGNLSTKIVEVDDKPHLILIAKDDIPSGTEVCYDYGDRNKESIRNHPWLAF